MNLAQYQINSNEYLEIRTDDLPLNLVYNCYNLDIWFIGTNQKIRFGYEDAGSFCTTMQYKIPPLLQKKLILNPDGSNDLGFLLNQEYQNLYDEEYGFFDYYFLGNSHKQQRPYYSSWLYNDAQGNIILEICPKYPWNDEDENDVSHPDFISYDQFMKNYQPTIIRTIEPKYLEQWLEQANILALIFEKNEIKDLERNSDS